MQLACDSAAVLVVHARFGCMRFVRVDGARAPRDERWIQYGHNG